MRARRCALWIGCGSSERAPPGGAGSSISTGDAATATATIISPLPDDSLRSSIRDAAFTADAGSDATAVAAQNARRSTPPVDVTTLAQWPLVVPPKRPDDGPPVEVYAIDADVNRLLVALRGKDEHWVLRSHGKRITGRVAAPSRGAAFATVAKAAGLEVPMIRRTGRGATVTFDLQAAAGNDVLRSLADNARLSMVASPPLPALDVVVTRVPWDDVAAEVIAAANVRVHRHPGVWYLLPTDATVPPTT